MDENQDLVERLRQFALDVDEAAGYVEQIGVSVIVRVAPWAATLPTAYTVYTRTQQHLHWSLPVAGVAGVAVETLGLAVSALALRLRSYNRAKRKSDETAPAWIGYGLVAVYFLAAEALVAGLEIAPQIATGETVGFLSLVPAIFPALSLAATMTVALRDEQRQREDVIEARKAEQRASRSASRKTSRRVQDNVRVGQSNVQENAREGTGNAQNGVLDAANMSRRKRRAELLDEMVDIYRDSPKMGATDLANRLGIGRSTVYTYNDALIEDGRISRNGQGWLVK